MPSRTTEDGIELAGRVFSRDHRVLELRRVVSLRTRLDWRIRQNFQRSDAD